MININKDLDSKLNTISNKQKKSAFTLIELIVVIAISSIKVKADFFYFN